VATSTQGVALGFKLDWAVGPTRNVAMSFCGAVAVGYKKDQALVPETRN